MLVIQDWAIIWIKTNKGEKQDLQELKAREGGWSLEGAGGRYGGLQGDLREEWKQFPEACASLSGLRMYL